MAFTIRMRTVARFLVLMSSLIVWLVALAVLNKAVLRTDETLILVGSVVGAILQTFVLVLLLRI